MPKVSVLLPVYNTKEQHLRDAMDSVLSQTFTDFELVIINDASSDANVEKVVKSYSDKRIKYSSNENNLGISKTRNKLIDLAEGEYLAVMDHDDISLPARFEKEVAYLDEHADVGVVSSQFGQFPGKHNNSRHPVDDADIRVALIRGCAIWHSASMIRKSVLLDNNIRYEEKFTPAEDYAMWCRLIPHTKFHNIDEILFMYRQHETSTSKLQSKKVDASKYAIQAFVEAENPDLRKHLTAIETYITRVRLFGIIPLLKIITKGGRTKIYLFDRILICLYKRESYFI